MGDDFAYEARSIHYGGKKRKKGIYGKASKEEIVPLASGLWDVLDTCLSRSLSKKSLIIHPADLITIDPIANIKNK